MTIIIAAVIVVTAAALSCVALVWFTEDAAGAAGNMKEGQVW